MSHRTLLIGLIVIPFLFASAARSQEVPARADAKDDKALRQQAFTLLETIADQLSSLRSPQNRVRIGSNVAELLWDHDEKRARNLFAAVTEDFRLAIAANAPTQDESGGWGSTLELLRNDVLKRLAQHDPDLAIQFLHASRSNNYNHVQELRLASQIAAKSPNLALSIGRDSLDGGLSNGLGPLLVQLQQTDKTAGADLFKAIVETVQQRNLKKDSWFRQFAFELVSSVSPPQVDETGYRALVGIILSYALANGCAASDDWPLECTELGPIVTKIEKYYPAQARGLRGYASTGPDLEATAAYTNNTQWIFSYLQKATVDEMLALAENHPEMKDEILEAAVSRAADTGDLARARLITSQLPNEERRRSMLANIEIEQRWRVLSESTLSEIQESLGKARTDEQRITFLSFVAMRIAGTNRKGALTLLGMADAIVDSMKAGNTQLESRAELGVFYCSIRSDRGFIIMESLVPKLNQLVAAASILDGFENNYLRDEEWAMKSGGNLGRLLTNLSQNIGYFAWFDFDRSVNVAGQLDRPELRLMAQSKIAEAILTGQGRAGLGGTN